MVKKSRCVETWHLDDETIGPLLRSMHLGNRRIYRKGDFLYRQGAVDRRFYLILRGHVLIVATREDGSEFTLEMMGRRLYAGKPRRLMESPASHPPLRWRTLTRLCSTRIM